MPLGTQRAEASGLWWWVSEKTLAAALACARPAGRSLLPADATA